LNIAGCAKKIPALFIPWLADAEQGLQITSIPSGGASLIHDPLLSSNQLLGAGIPCDNKSVVK